MRLMMTDRMRRWFENSAMAWFACGILILVSAHANAASSKLFMLVSDESELSDMSEIINQVQVPVHVLDVGSMARMRGEINQEIDFINDLSLPDVQQRKDEIERTISRVLGHRKDKMGDVYRTMAVAGEIKARYGIEKTPTFIEIASTGHYRIIEEPSSTYEGVSLLQEERWSREPPELIETASERTAPKLPGPDSTYVTLIIGDKEAYVPRRIIYPITEYNKDIELVPVNNSLSTDDPEVLRRGGADTFIVTNPEALGDLSHVRLVPRFATSSSTSDVYDEQVLSEPESGQGSYRATFEFLSDDIANDSSAVEAIFGERETYSVLDAVLDGSSDVSFDCFDLRLTGVCTYFVVRVFCALVACWTETGPEASIELTHYNPEFLVGVYKRLGDSPLDEAGAIFNELQLIMAGGTMEVFSGEQLSDDFYDPDKWGSTGSQSGNTEEGFTTETQYHEVDVIGHPGILYSWMSADDIEPFNNMMQGLQGAPAAISTGVSTAVGSLPPALQVSVNVVTGTAESSVEPTPVPGAESADPETSFMGSVERPGGAELMLMMNVLFPSDVTAIAGDMLALYGTYTEALNLWNQGLTIATSSLSENISMFTDVDFAEYLEQMDAVIESVNNVAEGFQDIGAFAADTELWSMCPGASRFMMPYFLSGINLVQWKFNLPEIAFLETYAPPLPNFQHLYVGSGVLNNWGSIYPRQGTSRATDDTKAAAVAASRAVHVVTRPNQSHVYSHLRPYEERYLDISGVYEFNPKEERSGKWQALLPEVDDQCYVFGDDDLFSAEVGLPSFPWTSNRQTRNKSYAFAFWRESACCPTPRRAGAVILIDIPIVKIPFDIELIN